MDAARQPGGNEFYLRFANYESSLSGEWCVQAVSMLRLKVLASVVPLAIAAFFARDGLFPTSRPCIAIANTSVEMTDLPWHADLHVAFTEDPAAAAVRVRITENADAADFAIVDDAETAEAGACDANPATRAIWISDEAARGTLIIYLSHDGPANYRIFVRSKTFSQHDAAALVVGAGITGRTLQAASL
jgi:hypothetical protein